MNPEQRHTDKTTRNEDGPGGDCGNDARRFVEVPVLAKGLKKDCRSALQGRGAIYKGAKPCVLDDGLDERRRANGGLPVAGCGSVPALPDRAS